MDEIILTTEEKKLLMDEMGKSRQSRKRNIKKGLIILLASLTIAILTGLIDRKGLPQQFSRLAGAATAISIFISAFGLLNIYYWFWTTKKEINKLDRDITIGKKVSGQLKIIGYNFISRNIKLENGVHIDRYNIGDSCKKDDYLDIEYLPTSIYILKCHKNTLTKSI